MAADFVWLVEDALNQRIVGELPVVKGTYEALLRRPGYIKGTIASKDADANSEILDAGRFAVYPMRDGRIEQGGLIDTIYSAKGSDDVQFACRGWLSWFDRRKIRTDRNYPTATEQFTIVSNLVADAQDNVALGAGADLGITVTWAALSGITRVRTEEYRAYKGAWLGDAIRTLAAADDGFDFDMRYSFSGAQIAKTLLLSYPQQGVDNSGAGGFQFSRAAGFQYTRNERSNVLDRSMSWDASKTAWRVRQWGTGFGDQRLYVDAIDETKRGVYPMFDDDVTSQAEQTPTLAEQAPGSLATRTKVNPLPSLDVDTTLDPAWDSYWLGDTFDVFLDDGIASFDGPCRVTGFTMDVDADKPTLVLEPV